MAKRMTVDDFNRKFGEDYSEYNGIEQTYQVFNYWATCGYANMQEEANLLNKEARKMLLWHITCSRGMEGRTDEKIVTAIINTL